MVVIWFKTPEFDLEVALVYDIPLFTMSFDDSLIPQFIITNFCFIMLAVCLLALCVINLTHLHKIGDSKHIQCFCPLYYIFSTCTVY